MQSEGTLAATSAELKHVSALTQPRLLHSQLPLRSTHKLLFSKGDGADFLLIFFLPGEHLEVQGHFGCAFCWEPRDR